MSLFNELISAINQVKDLNVRVEIYGKLAAYLEETLKEFKEYEKIWK